MRMLPMYKSLACVYLFCALLPEKNTQDNITVKNLTCSVNVLETKAEVKNDSSSEEFINLSKCAVPAKKAGIQHIYIYLVAADKICLLLNISHRQCDKRIIAI